jgi:uncharacterized protein (TIGR03545 family)
MESAGSALIGAKVEFDGVDFSFLKLHMKWDSLRVTNPENTWKNIIATQKAEFDLDLLPLFSKKYIIENLQVEGLRFNSARKTDGKLEKEAATTTESKVVKAVEEKLRQETADMPVFNLQQYGKKINVDSLWNMVDLKTPHKTDSLKKVYIQKYQDWETRIAALPSERELQGYTREIESIKIDQIQTIDEFQKAYSTATGMYKTADSLYKNVNSLKSDLDKDISQVKENQKLISDWIKMDYQRALSLARLPDISVQNVAKTLFGQRIIGQLQQILGYIGKARHYSAQIKSSQPEKENPPRLKGQDIYYGPKENHPKYWIKQVSLSGEAWNGMQISGKVMNIVSRQKVVDAVTTISLSGSRKDQASLSLEVSLDYREDTPQEKIQLQLQKMPISNVKLTNFPLLPYKIDKGRGEVQAQMDFVGPDLSTDIKFIGKSIKFDLSDKPTDMDERLLRVSRSIVESIKMITINANVKRTEKKYSFNLNSNLDRLIADKFKSLLSQEVESAKKDIEKRVLQEVDKYRKDLDKFVVEKEKQIRAEIEKVENEVEKQKAMVASKQKEIEDKIAAEKNKLQKKAEDEGKKLLKDLFKK